MPSRPAPRITIKDLARELGMSVATVARAFHAGAAIAETTRAQVLSRAAALGYQPNALARGMITRRTRIVGVVVSDLHNPFYPEALSRLCATLQQAGCNTMLVTGREGPAGLMTGHEGVAEGPAGAEAAALRLLLSYQPECVVILATTLSSDAAAACEAAGTPLLYLNRFPGEVRAESIVCDNEAGAAALTAHLLAQGARRPAFIGGLAEASTQAERRAGFRRACAEAGLAPREQPAGAFTYEAGFDAALALLTGPEPPDALFCASDILALGALEAARHRLGLRVPQDLKVAGFDDIPMSAWPSHDLTTLRQPLEAMLQAALRWLGQVLDGAPPPPRLTRLPGTLVPRGSTASSPQKDTPCHTH
ncbi:LacI family DNA-binding transcriptional regulator [Pseudoroseomonas cervicalis]|uniref:LacI family DNA-binding transcriptional regulator n=1 Tax=Teichococcus cervicalis TaxID=204525 RepID=UPI0027872678|nr:LacI family DNA-binding transcriptional regulator [Pseudoroseomonas cervicalis]MDQ1078349.1 DNA-binding LacI/PurR family transcriptional regulator [Pseudoroseomonas cervicalis]